MSVAKGPNGIIGRRAVAYRYTHSPLSSCSGCLSSLNAYPYNQGLKQELAIGAREMEMIWIDTTFRGHPVKQYRPTSANSGSFYMYLEATNPNFPAKNAYLGSPCFDLTNVCGATFQFAYHMFGVDMGTLELQASSDNGVTWSAPIWSQSGIKVIIGCPLASTSLVI